MRYSLVRNKYCYLAWIIFLGAICCFLNGSSNAKAHVSQNIAWESILKAFDEYFNLPSTENAKKVLIRLPRERPDTISRDTGQALDYIISADNYGILILESMAGDRYSIEILFRLRNFSDGGFSETLDGTLGNILRINPKLFLDVLLDYLDTSFIKRCGVPVAFPGYAYDVHPDARRYDLEKRIEALDRILDPKYAEIKHICIKTIREALRTSKSG